MKTLLKRSISGLVFVGLVVCSLLFDKGFFIALFSGIVAVGIYEFHNLFQSERNFNHSWLLTATLGLSMFLVLVLPSYTKTSDLSALFNLWPVPILLYAIIQMFIKQSRINSLLLFIFAMVYVVSPFFLAFSIHQNDGQVFPKILGVFILVWTNDTFAYINGNLFGKHKLYEKISPNKTWEGFAGGFIFTLILGFIMDHYIFNGTYYSDYFWSISACVLAPAAVLGDLFESGLKRKMNVKDTGNIMPGHGGVLDRFDAMLLALPVFYIWLLIDSLF